MRMRLWACSVFLLCLAVGGCGSKEVSEHDWIKIKKGMSLTAVEELLGTGKEIPWSEVKHEMTGMTVGPCDKWLIWGNKKKAIYVGFKDGVVNHSSLHK